MSRVEILNYVKLHELCSVMCLMIFLAEFSDILNSFKMLRGKDPSEKASVISLPHMIFELDA